MSKTPITVLLNCFVYIAQIIRQKKIIFGIDKLSKCMYNSINMQIAVARRAGLR
jgi:hypothetical protein